MKLPWLFSIILISTICFGQDPVILTINGSEVHKSEFEQIYWKNKKEKLATKEDLDEYIKLFVNFKLKVLAAENLGLDTLKKFTNELNGYKIQLQKPYLTDTSINEDLLKEAYFRTVNEINASHIMVKLPINPSAQDTLKAWEKISNIRTTATNPKTNFEDLALEVSEDPSAKENKGNLGYFSAFKMIYAFEEAAYTTPIGKVSKIVRTRYGYHLVKPNQLRKAKGKIKASHIMIAVQGKNAEEYELAYAKIMKVYDRIVNGEPFNELAKDFSDDRNSARKGGELGWIGSGGNFYKEFEEAVFSLKSDNEYSKPFKTPNGWHIVKRLEFEPIGDFEKIKYELKNKIQKDSRAQKTISSFIEILKKEYDLVSFLKVKDLFTMINSKSFDNDNITNNKNLKSSKKIILTFSDKKYSNFDFIQHLHKIQSLKKCQNDLSSISKEFNNFLNKELIEYEKTQLSSKHPEYKALMKEYRDGILLFEISDQKIWTKAIKDTLGLKKFYDENTNKWNWPNRINGEFFTAQSKKEINKVYSLKKKGNLSNDSIVSLINNQSSEIINYNKEIIDDLDTYNLDFGSLKLGLTKPFLINQKWIFINITELLPARTKTMDEAEGLIVTAYQNHLEKIWLEELKSKNEIKINFETLYSIKEKP